MKRLFSFCCLLLALCLISAHGQEPPQVIYTDAAILSRALDREVINLGFSGNARLDLEVAQLIAQAALFARLVSAGEQGLFYVPGEGLIGTDGEATVDGCHFTDLGMMRYVEKLLPVVREALKRYN